MSIQDVITYIGLPGAILSIVIIYLWIHEHVTIKRVSCKKFFTEMRWLINEIRKADFNPDVVIGIGRGGSIVAAIISSQLRAGIIPLYTIDWHYKDGVKDLIVYGNLELDGKNVLICTAEDFTGGMLHRVKRQLINNHRLEKYKLVSFYSLHCKKRKSSKELNADFEKLPDFVGITNFKQEKFLPWQFKEMDNDRKKEEI